jgi:hypothetical protein
MVDFSKFVRKPPTGKTEEPAKRAPTAPPLVDDGRTRVFDLTEKARETAPDEAPTTEVDVRESKGPGPLSPPLSAAPDAESVAAGPDADEAPTTEVKLGGPQGRPEAFGPLPPPPTPPAELAVPKPSAGGKVVALPKPKAPPVGGPVGATGGAGSVSSVPQLSPPPKRADVPKPASKPPAPEGDIEAKIAAAVATAVEAATSSLKAQIAALQKQYGGLDEVNDAISLEIEGSQQAEDGEGNPLFEDGDPSKPVMERDVDGNLVEGIKPALQKVLRVLEDLLGPNYERLVSFMQDNSMTTARVLGTSLASGPDAQTVAQIAVERGPEITAEVLEAFKQGELSVQIAAVLKGVSQASLDVAGNERVKDEVGQIADSISRNAASVLKEINWKAVKAAAAQSRADETSQSKGGDE